MIRPVGHHAHHRQRCLAIAAVALHPGQSLEDREKDLHDELADRGWERQPAFPEHDGLVNRG